MLFAYDSMGYLGKSNYGVLVLNVNNGTPADKAGIAQNDVIIQVNNTRIRGIDDFINITKNNQDELVKVSLLRDGNLISTELIPRSEYPIDQGSTGLVIDDNMEKVDQGIFERVSYALYKSYLGYESIPVIPVDMIGAVGMYAMATPQDYVEYVYAGNLRYLFQLVHTLFLLIATVGLLKKKWWSRYLIIVYGLYNFILFVRTLMFIVRSGGVQLSLIYSTTLIIALLVSLLFIYISYYAYRNEDVFEESKEFN